MKTSMAVGVLAVLLVVAGGWFFMGRTSVAPQPQPQQQNVVVQTAPVDYKNISYVIDGQQVTLVNGSAETAAAPGSASKISTKYFGNGATGDLNGDGVPDVAFILTQNSGGSGTFYYVVAALKTPSGYQGTSALLLGDRIAPQTTEIKNGQIIVNYADRKSGEPMTTPPSVGVSKYVNVTGTTLVQGKPIAGAGERCGGNMTTAPTCSTGFHCAATPGSHLPFGDVGGTCVAN